MEDVESSDLISLVRDYLDQLIDDLDIMDDDLTTRLDNITDQGDDISDVLKDGKDSLKEEKRRLDDLMDDIEQVLKDGKERVRNRANNVLDEENFFNDISDEAWEDLSNGMITECRNTGTIAGETEAGGITGSIGVKVLEDLKDRIATDGERSLNLFKEVKAVVSKSQNDGLVRARYDYAGRIVGNMKLGALRFCENYGTVSSKEGDYVGGIAGKCDYIIRSSYSMCAVSGCNYIGGIAGFAMNLYDNVAMTTINSTSGERFGSIAGAMDEDGTIAGNIYVDDGFGAVNGISYTTQANGITCQELLKIPELPSRFCHLNVSFWCEDSLVDSVDCNYGDSLSAEAFPKLPDKPGYYYEWDQTDLEHITNNMQIHAVYRPWITAISSDEEPMAMILAEGEFWSDTRISVLEADSGRAKRFGYRKAGCFRYEIRNRDDSKYEGDVVIRLLAEDYGEKAVIDILNDGELKNGECRRDGKYLVFYGSGSGTLVVFEPIGSFVIGLAGVSMIAAALFLCSKKRKFTNNLRY